MINYSKFNKTGDHAYNIARAIDYCRKNNIDGLKFEKGIYELSPKLARSTYCCVSNHTIKGRTSIAFLIEEMENFTIDGGGASFVSDGVEIGFAVLKSKNITIKNLCYNVKNTLRMSARVIRCGNRDMEIKITNGQDYYIADGNLHIVDNHGHDDVLNFMMSVNMNDDTGYMKNVRQCFDFSSNMKFRYLSNGNILIEDTKFVMEEGTNFVILPRPRHGCGILVDSSQNTNILNVSMNRGYSMGIIGQFSEDITVSGFDVRLRKGEIFSLNADATHFVSCTGKIAITDSYFEGMLDDALNVHGIFTRIEKIDENGILVHDLHPMAKGFELYRIGSEIAVMPPDSLIPKKKFKVLDVCVINDEYTYLTLDDKLPEDWLFDTVEELTMYPEVVFENNEVLQNRARGILLSSKGKTVIKNNYFHTPGAAVLFESDGEYWYESGSVDEVLICDNTFDDCNFTGIWGRAQITVNKRKAGVDDKFYHRSISVKNNVFTGSEAPLYASDTEIIEFSNNTICRDAVFENCGEIIQKDNKLQKA